MIAGNRTAILENNTLIPENRTVIILKDGILTTFRCMLQENNPKIATIMKTRCRQSF